jgi:hypothetical protein
VFLVFDLKSHINYIPSSHVIHVHVEGRLTSSSDKEVALRVLRLAQEYKCSHVLCDYTQTTVTDSISEIYDYPKRYHAIGFPRTIKVARIYASDETEHLFWETVCHNRGFDFRVFKTEEEALNWLKAR